MKKCIQYFKMWPSDWGFLLLGVQLLNSVNIARGLPCRTPFGALSERAPLQDCPPLLQMLYKYGENMPSPQRQFLTMSFVDYGERIVCCDPEFNEERAFASVGAEILRNAARACGERMRKRIAFGTESTLLSHPWSVLLMYDLAQMFQCGGTLITNRYVLTAAHCVMSSLSGVRLGEHRLSTQIDCERDIVGELHCMSEALDVGIDKVIKHPQYTTPVNGRDIALLRLDRYVTFIDNIRTICIPEYQHQVFSQEEGIITGWGTTESGTRADVHMEATVPVISSGSCQAVYRRVSVDNAKICTRSSDGKATCRGDSGGPLIVRIEGHLEDEPRKLRFLQLGITSMGGSECGSKNPAPEIYTRVASFVDWIANNIEL